MKDRRKSPRRDDTETKLRLWSQHLTQEALALQQWVAELDAKHKEDPPDARHA